MGVKGSKLSRGTVSYRRSKGHSSTPQRGYIPVAVGLDGETVRRFMVHRTALSNAEFVQLLRRSAEEYGFRNDGVLRIRYDAKAFEEWMKTSGKHKIFRIQPTNT